MEWKEVDIRQVTSILGDGLHGTPQYDENGEYYFINGNNLVNGHIEIKSDTKKVNKEEYEKYKKELNDRTLMVSINGTIGNVAKYNGEPCILGKSACYFNVNKDVDRDFIYYIISSPTFARHLTNQATGTTIKNVSLKQMRGYRFHIPADLKDQRRIASILSSLDRKIELNNKINAQLEEMAQALFKSWFVNFEPFKDGKFVESELGMIPEGWRVGSLNELVQIIMGQSPVGSSLNEEGKGTIFYQGCSDFTFRYPKTRVYTTEPARMAEENSVLFSVRAPVGAINMARVSCCIGRGVASIKSKNNNDSFIYYLMKSLHKLFDSYNGEGTVFGSINKKTLEGLQIIIPTDKIITEFDKVTHSLDTRILNLCQESLHLAQLRDTLLPKLMNGEIEL